jgi:uncharacterized membrane protein
VSDVDRKASLGLSGLGLAASGYLTYVHYAGVRVACPTSGCERVQQSFYATPHGVPLSLFGVLLFLAIGALTLARGSRVRVLQIGLALAGGTVAVYLVGVQLVSLGATCLWCLTTDVALVGLAGLAVVRLVADSRRESAS